MPISNCNSSVIQLGKITVTEIIPDLLADCYQGPEEVHEVNHPAFPQAPLCLNSFKLQETGIWLMALDRELQTAVVKETFLPL